MRTLFRCLGNLLLAVSLGLLVLLALGVVGGSLDSRWGVVRPVEVTPVAAEVTSRSAETTSAAVGAAATPLAALPTPSVPGTGSGGDDDPVSPPSSRPTPVATALTPVQLRPITKVILPRLSLAVDVVPAPIVHMDSRVTWEVPAFKAGHAEATAGAGERGNAVLVGHVRSRHAGNVFKDLNKVQLGDRIQVFSGAQQFDYRVVEVRIVARTDVSLVQPTETASLSLITCAGIWLPILWDYTERLVVRAEFTSSETPAAPAGLGAPSQPSPRVTRPLRTILDEPFDQSQDAWPNDPEGTAWVAGGAYYLYARQPGRFVAIRAPITEVLHDVVVTARFRKIGGPPGGGYGLIVRDQGPGPRDGLDQGGRYYVVEASDRGEVGIWRRELDRWITLLPWTPSEAVRLGGAMNELTVQATGERLSFWVNGIEVVSQVNSVLSEGAVGIFVGGDLNGVVLDRFTVQAPE